jgi:ParB family chromosome partitioning protein
VVSAPDGGAGEGNINPVRAAASDVSGIEATEPVDAEEEDALVPISDRLLTELTAHRTLGLREALGRQPDMALLSALHVLTLKAFYPYAAETCLEIELRTNNFGAVAGTALQDAAAAEMIRARHENWSKRLPENPGDLWEALGEWDVESRGELFAHVVSLSVSAVHEGWSRRPGIFTHADHLAQALELDMTKVWSPTAASYFGRVPKVRILQAVAEAKGQRAADRIAHLKKADMASEAEDLLAGSGWLPDVLRPVGSLQASEPLPEADTVDEPGSCDGETVHPIAAE